VKVAILGAGKMGVWFAKFFLSKGFTVVLADRKEEKLAKLKQEIQIEITTDFKQAIKYANQILICVSISALEEVVKTISSDIHAEQVIMDISSIKEKPVKIMQENLKGATILGTHPLFGPGSKGIKHKAYVLTPTNSKERKFADELKVWLEKEEARVFIMTPKKHDELMSIVLGFPHFIGLVAFETLLEQENLVESKKVAGTTYRMLFTLAEATAMETPDLYANLQTSLPELEKIEELFMAKARDLLGLIKRKDTAAIMDKIESLKSKMVKIDGDYAESYKIMYKMLESTEK
jgi:prephenate dehydrogenase